MATYEIDQGDDETIHMSVKSPLKADALDQNAWSATDTSTWGPMNLTGSKLWLSIKAPNGDTVIGKTSETGEGITITDAPGGLADVDIAHTETSALDSALIGKSLRLEVQIRSSTGRISTLKRATITILRDRLTAV